MPRDSKEKASHKDHKGTKITKKNTLYSSL